MTDKGFLRPAARAALHRGREVIAAGGVVLFGAWVAWLGGYLLLPLGLAIVLLGAVLARQALRRMRFVQAVGAPGLVELDEAQVGYLGPEAGGFLSLEDMVELRLLKVQGRRMWRLKQSDGQALLIPVEAQGAERLFDAFAALPGMDTGALVAAVQSEGAQDVAEARVIWRRPRWANLPRAAS